MPTDSSAPAAERPSDTVLATQVHLHGFLRALRDRGLPVSVPKQVDFFAGVAALAPSSPGALYWTAVATLLTSWEAHPVFDEVFQQFFGSLTEVALVEPDAQDDDEEQAVPEPGGDDPGDEAAVAPDGSGDGLAASRAQGGVLTRLPETSPASRDLLHRIAAELPHQVPTVRSRRKVAGRRRERIDLRATGLEARRTHGEIVRLRWRHRPNRQRRLVLLIDVSRSMREQSIEYLRFAHSALASCERVEVFTFGTRLTRVTGALRPPEVDTALSAMTDVVHDADGGTQIGDSLLEFLANGRYQTLVRGAVVVVMSDGLERGDCESLRRAVRGLRLLAAQLTWWSPLACDERYEPLTRGMALIRPDLDSLVGVEDLTTALHGVRAGFPQHAGT